MPTGEVAATEATGATEAKKTTTAAGVGGLFHHYLTLSPG